MTLTLIVCLVLLMVLGFPVAFALAIASAIAVFVGGKYPQLVVFKEMFTGIDSFPLMAVPFCYLCGRADVRRRADPGAAAFCGTVCGAFARRAGLCQRGLIGAVLRAFQALPWQTLPAPAP